MKITANVYIVYNSTPKSPDRRTNVCGYTESAGLTHGSAPDLRRIFRVGSAYLFGKIAGMKMRD